jgi:ankyrin repeat protein
MVDTATRRGADFDLRDKNDRTPLSRAAQNGHEKVLKLLLEEGLKQHPELDTDKSGALLWGSRYVRTQTQPRFIRRYLNSLAVLMSATITIPLIFLAFNVEKFEMAWNWVREKTGFPKMHQEEDDGLHAENYAA